VGEMKEFTLPEGRSLMVESTMVEEDEEKMG